MPKESNPEKQIYRYFDGPLDESALAYLQSHYFLYGEFNEQWERYNPDRIEFRAVKLKEAQQIKVNIENRAESITNFLYLGCAGSAVSLILVILSFLTGNIHQESYPNKVGYIMGLGFLAGVVLGVISLEKATKRENTKDRFR